MLYHYTTGWVKKNITSRMCTTYVISAMSAADLWKSAALCAPSGATPLVHSTTAARRVASITRLVALESKPYMNNSLYDRKVRVQYRVGNTMSYHTNAKRRRRATSATIGIDVIALDGPEAQHTEEPSRAEREEYTVLIYTVNTYRMDVSLPHNGVRVGERVGTTRLNDTEQVQHYHVREHGVQYR